ncbi:MAG: S49 family peptidase, partial [Hyphomonadaceae bacterium]
MKQFLITVAGVLVGLVVFLIIAPIVIVSLLVSSASQATVNPNRMVLSLDLREEMSDSRPQSPFAAWGGRNNVIDIVQRIEAASRDNRVRGIYVRAQTFGMSPAHAEEIRSALADFQRAGEGRFVIGHIQNEGVRLSMAGYMAVAGADELWLQGVSEFMPMGLSSEQSFFADTLARYRVTAHFETREEFKSAADTLTQRGFTESNRLQTTELLNSLYTQMLAHIAADRSITPAAARAAIEQTPFTGQRARELRLIDQLGQPEQAERAALDRAGEGAEFVDILAYQPRPQTGGPTIAVVLGEGEIIGGTGESS